MTRGLGREVRMEGVGFETMFGLELGRRACTYNAEATKLGSVRPRPRDSVVWRQEARRLRLGVEL